MRKAGSVFAVLMALVSFTGCASLPGAPVPEIRGIDARINRITFDSVGMQFDVAVHNPNLASIHTPLFRYDLAIAGKDFLSSSVSGSGTLPPGTTSTVALPVRISYEDLFRSYPALRDKARIRYRLRVAVSMPGTNMVEVPYYHEGSFPTVRPPTATATKVELSEVSLNEAKLTVTAEIENPNAFTIGVEKLDYTLETGGISINVRGDSSDKQRIAARRNARVELTRNITSSEGLIRLLINGVPDVPKLSVAGPLWTPYGTVIIEQ